MNDKQMIKLCAIVFGSALLVLAAFAYAYSGIRDQRSYKLEYREWETKIQAVCSEADDVYADYDDLKNRSEEAYDEYQQNGSYRDQVQFDSYRRLSQRSSEKLDDWIAVKKKCDKAWEEHPVPPSYVIAMYPSSVWIQLTDESRQYSTGYPRDDEESDDE